MNENVFTNIFQCVCVQSNVSAVLCSQDECVQQLKRLWEETRLTGAHSFELAITQTTVPHKKVLSQSLN